ncbi:unnamed protein product [Amoebophrya sp. A120]|nr:unnamed protein product [Amoebophrya sp. A120]|eukprot:GSA120T00013735001.1
MPPRTKSKMNNKKTPSAFLLVALNMQDRDRIFVQSVKIVSSESSTSKATTTADHEDVPSRWSGESAKQNQVDHSSADPTSAPGGTTAFLFFPTSSLWPHEFLSSWLSSSSGRDHGQQASEQKNLDGSSTKSSGTSGASTSTLLETKQNQKQIKYGNLRGVRNKVLGGRATTSAGTELRVVGSARGTGKNQKNFGCSSSGGGDEYESCAKAEGGKIGLEEELSSRDLVVYDAAATPGTTTSAVPAGGAEERAGAVAGIQQGSDFASAALSSALSFLGFRQAADEEGNGAGCIERISDMLSGRKQVVDKKGHPIFWAPYWDPNHGAFKDCYVATKKPDGGVHFLEEIDESDLKDVAVFLKYDHRAEVDEARLPWPVTLFPTPIQTELRVVTDGSDPALWVAARARGVGVDTLKKVMAGGKADPQTGRKECVEDANKRPEPESTQLPVSLQQSVDVWAPFCLVPSGQNHEVTLYFRGRIVAYTPSGTEQKEPETKKILTPSEDASVVIQWSRAPQTGTGVRRDDDEEYLFESTGLDETVEDRKDLRYKALKLIAETPERPKEVTDGCVLS